MTSLCLRFLHFKRGWDAVFYLLVYSGSREREKVHDGRTTRGERAELPRPWTIHAISKKCICPRVRLERRTFQYRKCSAVCVGRETGGGGGAAALAGRLSGRRRVVGNGQSSKCWTVPWA